MKNHNGFKVGELVWAKNPAFSKWYVGEILEFVEVDAPWNVFYHIKSGEKDFLALPEHVKKAEKPDKFLYEIRSVGAIDERKT